MCKGHDSLTNDGYQLFRQTIGWIEPTQWLKMAHGNVIQYPTFLTNVYVKPACEHGGKQPVGGWTEHSSDLANWTKTLKMQQHHCVHGAAEQRKKRDAAMPDHHSPYNAVSCVR